MSEDQLKTRAHLLEPFVGWSPSSDLPNGRLSRFIGPMVLPIFTRQYNSAKQLYTYVHFIWLSTEIRTTARNYRTDYFFLLKPFSKTKQKYGRQG